MERLVVDENYVYHIIDCSHGSSLAESLVALARGFYEKQTSTVVGCSPTSLLLCIPWVVHLARNYSFKYKNSMLAELQVRASRLFS